MPPENHILVAFNAKNVNENSKQLLNSADSNRTFAQISYEKASFIPAGLSTVISQIDGMVTVLYLIEKVDVIFEEKNKVLKFFFN